MEADIAAVKLPKYGTSDSGDTLEIIERPRGGISLVLVDGQRNGPAAKVISNIAARKAISLLGEGVRDGAAARATHDYLVTHRRGQVSAELQIVSVDLQSRTLVISRNTHCPAYILQGGVCLALDDASVAIGLYPNTKPVVREFEITAPTYALLVTDGVLAAGKNKGLTLDLASLLVESCSDEPEASKVAELIIGRALEAEAGRPSDDMSVVVVGLRHSSSAKGMRKLTATIPL